MGGKESFREGREDLQELVGIEVGTKAVERMAEAVGEAIRGVEEERGERIWSGKVGPCCAPAPAEEDAVASTMGPVDRQHRPDP